MALVCMLTCIFGLTACGSGEELTAYEQQKVDNAEQLAASIVPLFTDYLCNAEEVTSPCPSALPWKKRDSAPQIPA